MKLDPDNYEQFTIKWWLALLGFTLFLSGFVITLIVVFGYLESLDYR